MAREMIFFSIRNFSFISSSYILRHSAKEAIQCEKKLLNILYEW